MTKLDPGQGLEERFATLHDGRTLRYAAGGTDDTDGPLVVLEAGMGGSSGMWVVVQRLLSARTRTIAYDRSGTGVSDPDPDDVARDLDRLVEDLGSFLDVVAPGEPVVLVGHSWGGAIIRTFALRSPERVAGLVLVDGSNEASLSAVPAWVPVRLFGAMKLLVRLRLRGVAEKVFTGGHAWPEVSDADRPLALRDLTTVSGLSYVQREARGLPASLPVLKDVDAQPLPDVPVVYLAGADVPKRGAKTRQKMVDAIRDLADLSPQSRLVMVEGAGHGILLEQPTAVADEIGLVLDEVAADVVVEEPGHGRHETPSGRSEGS